MNEKNNKSLFFIIPYETVYHNGGYFYDDETCATGYRPSSTDTFIGDPLIFDKSSDLLQWFYENATKKTIPRIYKINYIGNYKGLDDVIKMTNLSNNETKYYTALNQEYCACYLGKESERCNKYVWDYFLTRPFGSMLSLKQIYKAFSERGIDIKCNVYENNEDKRKCFEFCGEPSLPRNREKIKTKKLILYRPEVFW